MEVTEVASCSYIYVYVLLLGNILSIGNLLTTRADCVFALILVFFSVSGTGVDMFAFSFILLLEVWHIINC